MSEKKEEKKERKEVRRQGYRLKDRNEPSNIPRYTDKKCIYIKGLKKRKNRGRQKRSLSIKRVLKSSRSVVRYLV